MKSAVASGIAVIAMLVAVALAMHGSLRRTPLVGSSATSTDRVFGGVEMVAAAILFVVAPLVAHRSTGARAWFWVTVGAATASAYFLTNEFLGWFSP